MIIMCIFNSHIDFALHEKLKYFYFIVLKNKIKNDTMYIFISIIKHEIVAHYYYLIIYRYS